MTTIQQDSTMPSLSTAPDGGNENIVLQGIINDQQRHHKQISDLLNHNRAEIDTLKHNCMNNYKHITKLEALVAEKDSELNTTLSDYKDYRDTSQQEYTELQATSQQLIDKLQREIVDVTAQKEKYKERLDKFISFTQSFTPDKPEAKALAENGSDDTEEQPVGGIAASSVASPPADRHAVLDTSLQNKHFDNPGDEGEEEVDNEPSALKKSEEVAKDEDSEEDTSSPPASPLKSEEDGPQDDKTAATEKSDDEGQEFDENEPCAKEEEEDKDVEEDAKEVKEDEEDGDGKNVDTLKLLPIAENQPVEADKLKLLTTPDKKSIEYKSDEDDDEVEYETASEDMGEVTTRDAGSQTPPPSRKTRSSSSSVKRVAKSPKNKMSSSKKQKKSSRRTQ